MSGGPGRLRTYCMQLNQLTQEKQLSSEVAESSEVTSLEEEVRRLREESARSARAKCGLAGAPCRARQRGFVVAVLFTVCSYCLGNWQQIGR